MCGKGGIAGFGVVESRLEKQLPFTFCKSRALWLMV